MELKVCLNINYTHIKTKKMSVQTLSPENLNYIKIGIERAAYNNQVNDFYYYPIHLHFKDKDIEKESKRLISSWADLNMKSYCLKYKDDNFVNMADFMGHYPTKKPLKAIQLLKYVECLSYNIEPEHWELTEQEKQDLALLNKTKDAIAYAIVGSLPEYEKAAWND